MGHSGASEAHCKFSRQAKLTRPQDFERALRRPDLRLRAGPLRVSAVFNRMHCARLGLVVGKKAVARASARNRIKRVIRDRFRLQRRQLAALDVVFRVVGPIQRADLHKLLDELLGELNRKTGHVNENRIK